MRGESGKNDGTVRGESGQSEGSAKGKSGKNDGSAKGKSGKNDGSAEVESGRSDESVRGWIDRRASCESSTRWSLSCNSVYSVVDREFLFCCRSDAMSSSGGRGEGVRKNQRVKSPL